MIFALLTKSCRKYIDPSPFVEALKDNQDLDIGEQKDIGEFNLVLIEGLEQCVEKRIERRSFSTNTGVQIEESPITELFYGKLKQIVSSKEEDNTEISLKSTVMFGQIMLDVVHRDIYSAWEEAFNNEVEGFITPRKFHTQA